MDHTLPALCWVCLSSAQLPAIQGHGGHVCTCTPPAGHDSICMAHAHTAEVFHMLDCCGCRPSRLRFVVRTLYIAATATVACLIPFFSALMGLVGALGFTPLSFSLPPLFWLKVAPRPARPCSAEYRVSAQYSAAWEWATASLPRQSNALIMVLTMAISAYRLLCWLLRHSMRLVSASRMRQCTRFQGVAQLAFI